MGLQQRKEFIINSVLMIITAGLIMLISCQFTYGIMVIGSKSMTGTLNKGDAIIFEKYETLKIFAKKLCCLNKKYN